MSVKRRDLVRQLEKNGFHLLREGANHSIYSNGRITANEICKQAGIQPNF